MQRALIVPAAGSGSRLDLGMPKLLVPVDGVPMIERLFALYAGTVQGIALVVHPAALEATRALAARAPAPVEVFVQEHPTGMLDAILLARPAIDRWGPRRVWITWCDQVAIGSETVRRLAAASADDPAIVLPTCSTREPYVHLVRDADGRIVDVLHRREGDEMPEVGEGDAGLFDLARRTYLEELPAYAQAPSLGARTGERNFLPFLAAVARREQVRTFPCGDAIEALGVNTQSDLARVEAHLRARSARSGA